MSSITKKGDNAPKYSQNMVEMAYKFAKLGLKDIIIAKRLGITRGTFYEWKNKHKEFNNSITLARAELDAKVEKALLKRAVGFKVTEKKEMMTKSGEIVSLDAEKYYAPDTASIQFWLKNRDAGRWKDRVETVHELGSGAKSFLESIITQSLPQKTEVIEVVDAKDNKDLDETPQVEDINT